VQTPVRNTSFGLDSSGPAVGEKRRPALIAAGSAGRALGHVIPQPRIARRSPRLPDQTQARSSMCPHSSPAPLAGERSPIGHVLGCTLPLPPQGRESPLRSLRRRQSVFGRVLRLACQGQFRGVGRHPGPQRAGAAQASAGELEDHAHGRVARRSLQVVNELPLRLENPPGERARNHGVQCEEPRGQGLTRAGPRSIVAQGPAVGARYERG
jgi:hypothetical protein